MKLEAMFGRMQAALLLNSCNMLQTLSNIAFEATEAVGLLPVGHCSIKSFAGRGSG